MCVWAPMELYSNMTNYMYDNAGISTYLLPCFLGYSRVIVLLLTRDTHSPDSPQGLYHATFPNCEDVFPAALAFARELAANTSQTSVVWTKALLWRGADSIEGQHVLDSCGILDLASRMDVVGGMQAFKERRPVKFPDVLSKDLLEFVPWVRRPRDIHVLIYRTNDCTSYQWTEIDMRQRKAKL